MTHTFTTRSRASERPPSLVRPWWRLRRRTRADVGRWPYTIGICAALATLVGINALHDREALNPPDWPTVAIVTVAVLPWIIDLVIIEVPPPVFAPAVLIPVATLQDPSQFDALPLLLGVLALDMGLWLGPLRSTPVIAAATAVAVWPLASDTTYAPGWLVRPLTAIAISWVIGLSLHVRLQRQRTAAESPSSSHAARHSESAEHR